MENLFESFIRIVPCAFHRLSDPPRLVIRPLYDPKTPHTLWWPEAPALIYHSCHRTPRRCGQGGRWPSGQGVAWRWPAGVLVSVRESGVAAPRLRHARCSTYSPKCRENRQTDSHRIRYCQGRRGWWRKNTRDYRFITRSGYASSSEKLSSVSRDS